ncbi:MAG: type II toxin-antitoxin system RelE/ParE family toxin [Thermoflexibacter sp.]|jgi:plasmid stabilization system protein ParE|nr:type II toxin-antitoxin system RelE/ParE family toxin [Thermoflexibacter sp.]
MADYKVIVSAGADMDITDIVSWYEIQKEGLGLSFYLRFDEVLMLLKQNPFLYQEVLLKFRRALTQPYPYSIYYEVIEETKEVEVLAVIHQARSVEYISQRLKLS